MEISKSRIIVAFLVTITVVEIDNFVGISSPGSPVSWCSLKSEQTQLSELNRFLQAFK